MKRNVTISIAGLLMLAGCTVGPRHTPPEARAPGAWPEAMSGGLAAETADLAVWWRGFGDPMLDTLVERSLSGSLDLREAAARVREARAARGVTAADRLPTVNARGSGSLRRSSGNSQGGPGGAPGETNDSYDVGFDASWEIDVFGRVRRGVEAADADIDAAVESQRDARVVLVAEVARNYVEMRSAQARLAITEQNVKSQRETLGLSEDRLRAGLGTDLDVARALAQLETRRAQIPPLMTAQKQSAYRLDVLLGQVPGSLAAELEASAAVPTAPAAVRIGIPAELLRRRPDIRKAERDLAAATARVGVATADLYPRFMLSGNFGLQSGSLNNLVEAQSQSWSVGPLSVRWPIFDHGRVRAGVRVQESRQERALIAYERAVLVAHEEVANALVGYARVRERRESLARAVAANTRAVDLATDLWSRGLTDFLDVLDSQRALFLVQDQLAASDAEVATNLISLYKSLGGGWEMEMVAAEAATKE